MIESERTELPVDETVAGLGQNKQSDEGPSNIEASRGRPPSHPIPPFVWLTSLTVLALSLLGTLVLPLLIVPDEKHHADMVLMVQEGTWTETGWPDLGERLLDPAIIDASLSLGPREAALRENRAAQHPPLFYLGAALTSSVVTAPFDNLGLPSRLWSFRLVSVVASALLPVAFYLIAAELTDNRWARMASGLVPLGIPGVTLRDGSMVNNDALLILLTSLAILYAVRIATADLSTRTSLGLGMAVGLAALTKGNALVFLPVPIVAYGILATRRRGVSSEWAKSFTISGGTSLLLGGWWWIRNLVLYGAVQPIRDLDLPEPTALDWWEWITTAVERLVGSFWGGQFALGGRGYLPLFWTLTVLFVVTALIGWWRTRDRTVATVSGLYALLLVMAVLAVSASLYAERGRVSGVHGRYFFPAIAGIAPFVVLGVAAVVRRGYRWLPTVFAVGSTAMTGIALNYMLRRYWSSAGPGLEDRWLGVMAASPIPEPMTVFLLVLTITCFVALLTEAIRTALRNDQEPRPT